MVIIVVDSVFVFKRADFVFTHIIIIIENTIRFFLHYI